MAEIVKCPHCGAQHNVTYEKAAVASIPRTADCEICGQEMASWESSTMPIYRLKKHSIAGHSNGH
jgi:transcription elongation factor Elf1